MSRPFDPSYRRVLEAASFAARRHQGQLRKDGETPYASHPFRVCLIVRDLFGLDDPHMLMAALLHDVIEDTSTDFDDLAEQFGPEVAAWAAALSKDKRLPETQREDEYIKTLQQSPWQVQVCKLADMIDNLLDVARLEHNRHAHFLGRVEQYYEGLRHSKVPQMQGPLALAKQVIDHMRGTLSRKDQ